MRVRPFPDGPPVPGQEGAALRAVVLLSRTAPLPDGDGRAAFFEVKRDIRRFDENALCRKADAFLAATGVFGGYELEYRCLSLADL